MNERIKDKIKELEIYAGRLSGMTPKNIKIYSKDFKTKAACERHTEIIIGIICDIAVLVIKDKGFQMPENELNAFDILSKNNIISKEFADKLKDAKHMRNIIAHEYGEIDDEIVFNAIKNQLVSDVKIFIKAVKRA